MELLNIFDHFVFAKEMKIASIKNEYFTLGLQSKNKGSFAQYLFGIIDKTILLFR
jgi:hypothetical protein